MSIEDIIILGVVIVSIIGNVIKNFLKESKKADKRVVGQPAPANPQSKPVQPKPLFSKPANKPIRKKEERTIIEPVVKPRYETLETLEPWDNNESLEEYIRRKYDVKNDSSEDMSIYSTIEQEDISDLEEISDDASFVTQSETKKTTTRKKINSLFETKEDLKKAILYSAILERKY